MAKPGRVHDPFTGLIRTAGLRKVRLDWEAERGLSIKDEYGERLDVTRSLGVTERRFRGIVNGREPIRGRRIA